MPPIEVLPVKGHLLHPVFGTSFGIFATENIAKDLFIGEYACDILNGVDLSICKKPDSIMDLSGNNSSEDVYLGPKDYCGYILLVNSGKAEAINCKIERAIIGGVLRIVLIT